MLECSKEVKEAFGKETYLEALVEILDRQWVSGGGIKEGYTACIHPNDHIYEITDGWKTKEKFYPNQDKDFKYVIQKIRNVPDFKPETFESVIKRTIDYFVAHCKEQ